MNMSWGGYEPAPDEYTLKLTWKEKYELERLVKLEMYVVMDVVAFLKEKEEDTTMLEKDLEVYKKLIKKLREVEMK